jgi:hypothetical protein
MSVLRFEKFVEVFVGVFVEVFDGVVALSSQLTVALPKYPGAQVTPQLNLVRPA